MVTQRELDDIFPTAFKTTIDDHVNEAFKRGWYTEAIIILHANMEFFMNLIFTIYTNVKLKKSTTELKLTSFRYITIAEILFHLDLIDKRLFSDLKKFNIMRNKVAHEMFRFKLKEGKIKSNFEFGKNLDGKILDIFFEVYEIH